MALDVDLNVEVDRDRPDAESDSTTKVLRAGRYGEPYVLNLWNSSHMLCDEGSYFTTSNAAPGTAIAFVVNATVSETAGNFLYIKNNDTVGNGRAKRVYLDYIRLIQSVIPAAGIAGNFFIKTDRVDRYTSGGTQLTSVNPNTDQANSSVCQIFAGALTTVAPSPSARTVARGILRSVIPVANDEYIFKFGGVEAAAFGSLGGAVAQRMIIPCPPIILGPQANLCMQIWFASNAVTPAQFEIEVGAVER